MKNLKVLMLNGSPHANGNTAVALREMEEIFKASGVEVETVLIGSAGRARLHGLRSLWQARQVRL